MNQIIIQEDGEGEIGVGRLITAAHFNLIQGYSYRLWNVYNGICTFSVSSYPNEAVSRGTKIEAKLYKGIHYTIKLLQSYINNWADIDSGHMDVMMRESIDLLQINGSEAPIIGETITALADLRPTSGRNYLLQLYDELNLLR